ncbi:GNAT family N-acetyltransferase [Chryseobacterium sp. GMJ5]|uniref:GNAT family N-acetyltransferase n=1 Tax=Chryseobacterium gilvum TaxID=2976534 RepID=A0ABT2VW86_9FLAO|nr:GNAT family N-acetyltransferase [Chryseobacterium gilvum]MCU7614261.1 GNAT family N-acetyltransferase [Chryseobacterium gilvum]
MIKELSEKDLFQVAKIHKENLPSFLTEYPLSFIEKFYYFQIKRENQLLLGKIENGKLLGFVFGTDNVEKLYDNFISENKSYFYMNTFKTLLFHPKYFLLFAAKFFSKSFVSECKRQLVYIAVDQNLKTKGIGSELLQAFEEKWKGLNYYELEVESKNKAFDFYLKKGFYIVHQYNNWVEKKYLLGKYLHLLIIFTICNGIG